MSSRLPNWKIWTTLRWLIIKFMDSSANYHQHHHSYCHTMNASRYISITSNQSLKEPQEIPDASLSWYDYSNQFWMKLSVCTVSLQFYPAPPDCWQATRELIPPHHPPSLIDKEKKLSSKCREWRTMDLYDWVYWTADMHIPGKISFGRYCLYWVMTRPA